MEVSLGSLEKVHSELSFSYHGMFWFTISFTFLSLSSQAKPQNLSNFFPTLFAEVFIQIILRLKGRKIGYIAVRVPQGVPGLTAWLSPFCCCARAWCVHPFSPTRLPIWAGKSPRRKSVKANTNTNSFFIKN